jgi:hypothetical protein
LKTTHQIVLTDEYIADAQRLSIAQNKALRLMYQMWWTWWIPRVALAGFMIYGFINHFGWSFSAECGGFLVFSFVGEWLARRSLAKARKKVRFKGSTMTISMDDVGVEVVGESGNSHAKWSGILSREVYPNGVIVRFSPRATVWLPDEALTAGSADEVRRLLAENIRHS